MALTHYFFFVCLTSLTCSPAPPLLSPDLVAGIGHWVYPTSSLIYPLPHWACPTTVKLSFTPCRTTSGSNGTVIAADLQLDNISPVPRVRVNVNPIKKSREPAAA